MFKRYLEMFCALKASQADNNKLAASASVPDKSFNDLQHKGRDSRSSANARPFNTYANFLIQTVQSTCDTLATF